MRNPRTIFSQLLRMALLLVLPLVAFIGYGILQQFQDDQHDSLANLDMLRKFADRQIHLCLDDARLRMERLARQLSDPKKTRESVQQLLNEFAALNPDYTAVVLLGDHGGISSAASTPPAVAPQPKDLADPFRDALDAKTFYVSRPFKGPMSGRWIALLAYPVFDENNRKISTLLLSLDLIETSRLLAYDPSESHTLLGVFDDQGTLVMRSFEAEKYLGKGSSRLNPRLAAAARSGGGTGEIVGLDGLERTFLAAPLAGTPWLVAASMPSSEIYQYAWRNLWRALSLVAIALALVVGLLLRRAGVLSRPLMALAAAARAQSAGRDHAPAPETGSAEIAETAHAFNDMVAENRRAAESLKESESRYRMVIDQTGQMIYDLDVPSGRVAWFGVTAIAQITGCTPAEMNEGGIAGWAEKLHPDDRLRSEARLKHSLTTGEPCRAEYRMRHRDGSYRTIEEQGVVLRDKDGRLTRMLGCMSDVTARKQTQAALNRERALLRQIIDLVPHFIFAKDISGKFILANQPVATAYATTLENLIGKTDADFSPDKKEVNHFLADDLEVIRLGKPKNIPEETITDPGGNIRHLSTIKIPFRFSDSEIPAVLGVSVDITELKKADHERQQIERKLLETQKLESLGVLAGGIAHDFNNLLTGILGNASLARMDLSDTSPLLPVIGQIESATHRAADLCKQMLAYSGKGRFVVQHLNLNQLVEDTTHLLNISINKNCVLHFNLAASLPAIAVDATQIRQIIMNLVINASEAIGARSGVIAISTGVARIDQDYIATLLHPGGITPGDYVFLEVSDNGSGMSPATLAKIFDPFFTTKFTGRGLGLAAVLGIIRGHKGALKVYSESGRGTTFKILLPCSNAPTERVLTTPPVSEPAWRGQGTVLVVDDEETVRTVTARILETLGFTAVLASDGREALEIYRREPSRFAIVLLDLTMPHMDGEETFRQLRHINPGVRVVLMSGFNQQEAVSRFTGKGLAGFVQKPFEVGSIMTAVREAFFQS
jgi:PAS domain S-box-containing protein